MIRLIEAEAEAVASTNASDPGARTAPRSSSTAATTPEAICQRKTGARGQIGMPAGKAVGHRVGDLGLPFDEVALRDRAVGRTSPSTARNDGGPAGGEADGGHLVPSVVAVGRRLRPPIDGTAPTVR